MKILFTNDIHQMGDKWKQLVDLCELESTKPDIVAIAGDIIPKQNGILAEMDFKPHLEKYAKKIKDAGCELVLTLGNDDNQNLIPFMAEKDKEGLWYYVDEKVVKVNGIEFVGMSWVTDYPFGYKYWVHPDSNDKIAIHPHQLGGPVLINSDNQIENIPDLYEYINGKMPISEMLDNLADKVGDMSKSIWLVHTPPKGLGLDLIKGGEACGSHALLKFIQEKQPFIVASGHIHEACEMTGKWMNKVNDSICIQPGQVGFNLLYATVEIEDGKIKTINHSKYSQQYHEYK